jgi:hypothetical protein
VLLFVAQWCEASNLQGGEVEGMEFHQPIRMSSSPKEVEYTLQKDFVLMLWFVLNISIFARLFDISLNFNAAIIRVVAANPST